MEKKNIVDEMEEMREQMQMLRDKLDQQEIVNDKLIRNSVKSKLSWIKNYVYFEFLLLPFIALAWLGIKELFDISWFNYSFMMVMCTIDAVWDYRINVASLNIKKVEENSLTYTMQKLTKMKQMRAKSFFIMMPLCAMMVVWTGIEMWQFTSNMSDDGSVLAAAAYGGIVGGVIGIFAGFFAAIRIYRKMQRTNEDLIAQIEEFSK